MSLFKFSNQHTHTHETIHGHTPSCARTRTHVRGCPNQPPTRARLTRAARIPTAYTRRLGNGSLTGRNVNRNSLARATDAVSEPAFASRYTITRGLNRAAEAPNDDWLRIFSDRLLGPRSRTARRDAGGERRENWSTAYQKKHEPLRRNIFWSYRKWYIT